MSLDEFFTTLKARGNWGHEGRPGKHGGSLPKAGIPGHTQTSTPPTERPGPWSGEGLSSYSRQGNTYTKEDGPYTVKIKFTNRTAMGKKVGDKATITIEDVTLRPGFAHEPLRLDTGFTGKKLNRERVSQEADAYLEKIKREAGA